MNCMTYSLVGVTTDGNISVPQSLYIELFQNCNQFKKYTEVVIKYKALLQ